MPATLAFSESFTVKVLVVIVCTSIDLLKVALTVAFACTPVAASCGEVSVMVGACTSAAGPVVQVHGFGVVPATSALPAMSLAAVVTVDWYLVLGSRFTDGLKVAVLPFAAR